MVKYTWSQTHQAVGPGESFWFLVNTSTAQIRFRILAMALSCDQPYLLLNLSFRIFVPTPQRIPTSLHFGDDRETTNL